MTKAEYLALRDGLAWLSFDAITQKKIRSWDHRIAEKRRWFISRGLRLMPDLIMPKVIKENTDE